MIARLAWKVKHGFCGGSIFLDRPIFGKLTNHSPFSRFKQKHSVLLCPKRMGYFFLGPWCRLKQINLLMLWPTNDCLLLTLMPGGSAEGASAGKKW